jgi:tRNA A-37 threonylcarbamoyl transferase component Bud32
MKDIEELIKNNKKYENILIQKKFYSKKNTVSYVIMNNKPRILKWFAPGFIKRMQNEYNILNKGVLELSIPKIYEIDEENNILIMSYIPGKNVCDIINNENESYGYKTKIIFKLANWLKNFHEYYKSDNKYLIHGDSNLRNYIFTDKLWGVDFEESRIGKVEEDIANICTSLITTDPMYTDEKYRLSKKFLYSYSKSYILNFERIRNEISYSLLKTMMQRGKSISKQQSEEIVDNILYCVNTT